MNFKDLLLKTKANDVRSIEEISSMYKFLLSKEATIEDFFDEDLFHELFLEFINCIRKINVDVNFK